MRHSDFAVFYDQAHRLTCHQMAVNETTGELAESIRDMFIASMSNFGYVGFSRTIDDLFQMRSTYIYITESERVVMTCRVTPRPLGTILPFEMGKREDGASYHLDEDESVVDLNTYTYVRGYYDEAMPLLAAGMGHYVKVSNAKRGYCLYDVNNERIKRAYLSVGFNLSSKYPEPIHFPSFCRQIDGQLEPVRWRIMEWTYETVEAHASRAQEAYKVVEEG